MLGVLGVSLGMSGIYALLYYVRAEITVEGGISGTTATVVAGPNTNYVWLDVLDNLADVLHGLAPAFLAVVLLSRIRAAPASESASTRDGCGRT